MSAAALPFRDGFDPCAFLRGGGATGDLIRSVDWSATSLGAISTWPACLKSIVGMMLHSRHPMFLWWGPDLIQFYNDAYVPSFGAGKHPAAMGQRGRDCWQEIWPIIEPQIDDVMKRGRPSWNEDALVPIFRNGRIEEVYWTYGYSPVLYENGRIGGTLVVCTETTARVIAARRLHTLRSLSDRLSACTSGHALVEAAFEVLRSERLDIPFALAYRGDPTTGRCLRKAATISDGRALEAIDAAFREERQATLISLTAEALEDGPWPEPPTMALICARKRPGAETFVFGLSARLPLDDAYSDFLAQVVAQIDIAETRIEAYRVRAEVEGERRALLLQAPVGTAILTGPLHVVELANPMYLQLAGGRDIVGKAYFEAFPELAGTAVSEVFDHVYETGEPFVAEEFLFPLDLNGSGKLEDCYFRFNLEPLRDAGGNVYGMMAVAVNITELVNARLVLEKADAEREKLLARLEAASNAKDEFLATVSHELRTPLTSILGWAQILKQGRDPSRVERGLATIERNAKAQAQLIEDILDVSRIVSGKTRMSMRRVDAGAVVRAAVEMVRPTAAAKEVTMHVEGATSGALIADEDRLQQIIWNLLTNSVKFTPRGGEVRVSVARVDAELTITVADTGKGIAATFLPHVFDRFRQDDASTTKVQAGLGLGLAIVRHLVELHGGTVTARSAGIDLGATFEVRLPVRAGEPPEKSGAATGVPAALKPSAGPRAERRRLAGVHVLLVDDEVDARELVAMVLEDAGATVAQSESVASAMTVLDGASFDMLLSDIGMPGEDGYSFIQRVRSEDQPLRTRELPALAVTAFARAEDRDRALAAGFQEHVSKPIDPRALVASVAALVRR